VFQGPAKLPAHKFEIFLTVYHKDTNLRLLFHKWSKSKQDKWPKIRLVFLPCLQKNLFVQFAETPGAIPPNFCDTPPSFLSNVWNFIWIGSGSGEL